MSDKIKSIILKRFLVWEVVDHMHIIVEYESGRLRDLSVLDVSEIPYTIRDFMCEKNFRDNMIVEGNSQNRIIISRYEKRSGMNVSEYEMQE